jgi:hypothetical protein
VKIPKKNKQVELGASERAQTKGRQEVQNNKESH